nr:hypothetical protein [Lactococcus cremoris]
MASIFLLTILVAYLLAWFYRNDYDPMKMINAYLIYSLPFFLLGLFIHVRIILIFGTYILGMIILIFRNQHYFDR